MCSPNVISRNVIFSPQNRHPVKIESIEELSIFLLLISFWLQIVDSFRLRMFLKRSQEARKNIKREESESHLLQKDVVNIRPLESLLNFGENRFELFSFMNGTHLFNNTNNINRNSVIIFGESPVQSLSLPLHCAINYRNFVFIFAFLLSLRDLLPPLIDSRAQIIINCE